MVYQLIFIVLTLFIQPVLNADPVNVTQSGHKQITLVLAHPASIDWQNASTVEKSTLLDALDKVYHQTSATGYSIEFLQDATIGPYIEVNWYGAKRKFAAELSGVPVAGHTAGSCSFCRDVKNGTELLEFNARHIQSLSGRPLIIPTGEPIPVHWFQASRQTQLLLLEAAAAVQKQLNDTAFTYELHCGAPGGQTVWHLHLRLNRVP